MSRGLRSTAVVLLAAAFLAGWDAPSTDTVMLQPQLTGAWRWVDVADQEYGAAFQAGYDYTQAAVTITYGTAGAQLTGRVTAAGLKPNFAYQFKLMAAPMTASNEMIGYSGRWWEEEWLGTAWGAGANLNDKGDGSFPNPNDLVYASRKDTADASSPTGLHYKYSGYRVCDYFITDETGAADFDFTCCSSYHVLWGLDQRIPTAGDGPLVSHTFDVDPAVHAAYDNDYAEASRVVFGEWERLPAEGIALPAGDYECTMGLVEESFHGSGIEGGWALAMNGEAAFRITAPSGSDGFGCVPAFPRREGELWFLFAVVVLMIFLGWIELRGGKDARNGGHA